jgi:hypothetical protein
MPSSSFHRKSIREKLCFFNGKVYINTFLADELDMKQYRYVNLIFNESDNRIIMQFMDVNDKEVFSYRILRLTHYDYVIPSTREYYYSHIMPFLVDASIDLYSPQYFEVHSLCERQFYFNIQQEDMFRVL